LGLGNEGGLAVARGLSPVEYEQLVSAIREVVHRVVPLNATVLVVSRGDDQLLRLGPRQAMHFPQTEDGKYAGYHPADSESAIAMVEDLRKTGADYLLLPATGFWWLEHYEGFRAHLERNYQVVEFNPSCWIVHLSEGTSVAADTSFMAETVHVPDVVPPVRELIDALLPAQARIAFLVADLKDTGLDGHETWRMPTEPESEWEALHDSLRALEGSGIQFIVIPSSAFGWLAEHPEVAERLQARHRFVTRQEHLCEIYELCAPAAETARHPTQTSNAGSNEGRGESRRSFGEKLRSFLFSSRRNDRRA
jgi:hypothetical protein